MQMDLFGLYILFSHFRPPGVLLGISLFMLKVIGEHVHVHKMTFGRKYSLE